MTQFAPCLIGPPPQSTLLGLLSACAFELSILRCASRVMGSDGVRILSKGYTACSRPLLVGGDGGEAAAGGDSGGGAAPPAGAAGRAQAVPRVSFANGS